MTGKRLMPLSAASCRIDGSRAPGRTSLELIHAFTPSMICSVRGMPVAVSTISFMAGDMNCQENY